jgi:hypothetical protein
MEVLLSTPPSLFFCRATAGWRVFLSATTRRRVSPSQIDDIRRKRIRPPWARATELARALLGEMSSLQ